MFELHANFSAVTGQARLVGGGLKLIGLIYSGI